MEKRGTARLGARLMAAFFAIVVLTVAAAGVSLATFRAVADAHDAADNATRSANQLANELSAQNEQLRLEIDRAFALRDQAAIEQARRQVADEVETLYALSDLSRPDVRDAAVRSEVDDVAGALIASLNEVDAELTAADRLADAKAASIRQVKEQVAASIDVVDPLIVRASDDLNRAASAGDSDLLANVRRLEGLRETRARLAAIDDAMSTLAVGETAEIVRQERAAVSINLRNLVQRAVRAPQGQIAVSIAPALAATSAALNDETGAFQSALAAPDAANRLADAVRRSVAGAVRLSSLADQLATRAFEHARLQTLAASSALDSADAIVTTFAAMAVIGATLIVWLFVFRSVVSRIDRLTAATQALAAGDLDAPVGVRGNDELAAMAGALEHFRGNARALRESEAKLSALNADLARSNRDLEQFAYMASHDLQEPLRIVASYCDLLKRRYNDVLDDTGREFMGFAVDGAQRMRSLIDDLLRYSRLGRDGFNAEPFNLADSAKVAAANLQKAIEETGAELSIEPLPDIVGDKALIAQVFQNLIGNAIKFRGDAPPHIRISAEDAGAKWRILVSDNGIGIKPEFAERVFRIFQRLHTREEYAGNGIGLALCKRIVERHRGDINVETPEHGGATFAIDLPKNGGEANRALAANL